MHNKNSKNFIILFLFLFFSQPHVSLSEQKLNIRQQNDKMTIQGYSTDPNTLRVLCHIAMPWVIGNQVVETLIYVNNENNFIPNLASSWTISKDFMDLELRKGIFFQDGTPFNASSVIQNWQIYQNSAKPYLTIDMRMGVKHIQKLSSHKIRIEFNQDDFPGQIFVYLRSFYIYSPSYFQHTNNIYPNGNQANLSTPGNWGTGPYKLIKIMGQGSIAILEKNHLYWQKGYPKTDYIIMYNPKQYNSVDSHLIMKLGYADIFDASNPSMNNIMARSPYISLIINYPLSNLTTIFNMIKPQSPLTDIRVRKALNLLIDRKTLFKYLSHGIARMTAFIFPLSDNDMINPYPYSIEKAKKLLEEAGYNQNKKLSITIGYFISEKKLAYAIASMLNEGGIDVKFQEYTTRYDFYKHVLKVTHNINNPPEKELWDLNIVNIGLYTNSVATHFGENFISKGGYNWTLPDPNIDNLFIKAMKQIEGKNTVMYLQQLEQYLYNQYYTMPIYIMPTIFAVHKRVAKNSFSKSGYLLNLKDIQIDTSWKYKETN